MKKARLLSLCCAILLTLSLFPTAHAACQHIKNEAYDIVSYPTCYQTGVGKYTCALCGIEMGTVIIPATGNHIAAGGYVATDTHHYYKCQTPGCTVRLYEEEHTPGRTIADQEPTCGNAGVGHTLCYYCDATIAIEVRIPPTEMHEPDILHPVVDIPPTCSQPGEGHIICINCGATDKPHWTIPATGIHTKGAYVVVQQPTCMPGWKEATCTGCDLVMDTIEIPADEKHKAGPWITLQPATATATGLKEKRCKNCNTQLETAVIPKLGSVSFGDVKKSDYYYTPVQWAIENNITAGASKNSFAPNDPCTRGQIATFLWRAAGCPEPKSSKNPFTDVKKSDYYYKAVLWAVENNITAGATKTTFAPKSACTRSQVAAFLWRAAGSPKPTTTKNPFTDVKTKDFYYK
ncbi:MAG: S-layer homology domain-containing protein, partial [Clostridia bacterium]|nr:S-layer homology domain-containing protein [Clostridia bacterium]